MKQLSLFEKKSAYNVNKSELFMNQEELSRWKLKIYEYQQQALTQKISQLSLFDLTPNHHDADEINPFILKRYSSHFHRMPETGDHCLIYFIIDDSLPILLYVGETKRTAKQRWISHDCKAYIMSYKELHRKHQLAEDVNASFWFATPTIRKHRLQLETQLIAKFRSPFNKESWQYWGQPFTANK